MCIGQDYGFKIGFEKTEQKMSLNPANENAVYQSNFFAAGDPNGVVVAKAGIEYTDLDKRVRYVQVTIPYGTVWRVVATNVIVAIKGGYNKIEDHGVVMPQRDTLDFEGSGVTLADVGGKTVITIPGPTAAGSIALMPLAFTPAPDGVVTVFTITDAFIPGSLMPFSGGSKREEGVGYTLAGNVATMSAAPHTLEFYGNKLITTQTFHPIAFTGAVDGVNVNYTVSVPFTLGSLVIFSGGSKRMEGLGYVIVGTNDVVMAVAPHTLEMYAVY